MYLLNYSYLLLAFFVCFLIAIVVFLLSFILFFQSSNEEKNAIYECGFSPFEDARNKFEVKFYLVSILYIVFDLEVVFLLPSVMVLQKLDTFGLNILILFIVLVGLGFFYEWKNGAMDY